MRCQECGLENRDAVRFCEECGARLEARCPACGQPAPLGNRFCGHCGQPLTGAARSAPPGPAPGSYTPGVLADRIRSARHRIEGERKQVTVLFADIRGSLEMLGDRDPEEVSALLEPILARMMDAVHRYEGTVNQVLGDGIMALFGAPLAHEDHAVRACYAALDMHDSVTRHAGTLDVDIRIRIGLNSGEVVVRSIGNDLHMDYTAIGQTTHLAGRMEQLARPGTTLLTAATRRLAEGYVHLEPLGPTAVKGLATALEVYELVGRGSVRTRLEASRARAFTRFVGRQAELAVLARAAEAARTGRGQVVAVVGEPGVGKSRLVAEFITTALAGSWRVVETGTVSYARGAGSLTLVDLLRSYARLGDDEDRGRIETALAETLPDLDDRHRAVLLALLAPAQAGPAWLALEPSERRQRTLDAVIRVLLRHCETEPVCLVVEDLHWADAETQALLDRLVVEARTARLLMLATYRPEYRHGWVGSSAYTELAIQPLPRDDSERLLDDLLGRGSDLDAIKKVLVERTEGNPFFLEECVRDLAEKGVLVGRPGGYRRGEAAEAFDVPPSVHSVLAARIDRLPAVEKSLLQAASAIGTDVSLLLLEAVVATETRDLAVPLQHLQAAEFLYEVEAAPVPDYTFKHGLTRDVAYAGLLAERRRTLDGRIVDALERLYVEPTPDQVERLAHHAWRGEVWDRAVRHCREAGVQAYARSAHRAAVEYFEQALAALGHLPRTADTVGQAIDLRLDLRYALMPLGEFRQVFEHLSTAGTLARDAGDRRRLGLVSAFLTNYHHLMGAVEHAVQSGREALTIAAETGDRQTEILANAYLGLTQYVLGNYPDAIAIARRNVALLVGPLAQERFGSSSLPSVYSRTCLTWSLAELGRFDEGAAIAAEGLTIAEAARHSFSLVYACLGLGTLYLRQGAFDQALPVLERGFAICEDSGIPLLASLVAPPLTSAYVLAGRAQDAVTMLERASRHAESIGDPVERRIAPGAWSEAYLALGRPAEALPLAQRYLEERRRLGARGFEGWALRQLAETLARLGPGRADEAEASFDDALRVATERAMRPLEGVCRLGVARLHAARGKAQDARRARGEAEDIFRDLGMSYWLAQARASSG